MTNNYKLIAAWIFSLLIICAVSYAQIPNAGFENWHTAGFPTYNEPDNWGTLNSSTSIIGVFTTEKATGAGNFHSGSSSIKLSTHYISFASQTAPGISATGTINTNTQAIDGGFPFTLRSPALKGWFKGTPAANDSSQIEVSLWKWDVANHVRINVGSGTFHSSANVSNFTEFTIPITYSSPAIPDSALIILSSSNTDNPVDGSVFYVDDLSFVNCTLLTATTSTTNATCTANNGSATVTPANGTNPYSFLWSNSGTNNQILNVIAGTYTVTVTDANTCIVTASATVNANTNPQNVTASSTQSSCISNTGSVTASSSNGAPPFTYSWSNDSTTATVLNVGAGTYTVTITDSNGCSGTGTTSVTTPNGPSATGTATDVLCNGGSSGAIDITTTGGTGNLAYSWGNAVATEDLTNIPAGSYCVTITDANNCSFSLCETVSEPTALVIATTIVDATSSSATDGSVTVSVSGGTPAYNFSWNPNISTNNIASGVGAGVYCCTVTDLNSCTASICDTVSAPTGVSNISDETVKLYPNPASNKVVIETNSAAGKFSFSIYNLEGKLVEEKSISGETITIDVKHLPTGLYSYQLKNISSEKVSYGKLQIER